MFQRDIKNSCKQNCNNYRKNVTNLRDYGLVDQMNDKQSMQKQYVSFVNCSRKFYQLIMINEFLNLF